MLFTNNRSGMNFAKDPAVINLNNKYFLYFSALPDEEEKRGGSCLEVGIAVSDDMEKWNFIGTVPRTHDFEKKGIGAPAAIVLDGKVHLFYQTYGNGGMDAICHAVSDDGVNFVKDKTNPIFHPTNDWCCGRAIDADVCVFNNQLMLYTATRDHDFKIQKIAAASAPINSSFSRNDFTQLCRASVLAPELKWEQSCIEAPATVTYRGKVYMFYGGAYNCSPQQIGCAVSPDGRTFDKLFIDKPFIPCGGAGCWNSSESGHPYIFADNDERYWLFYQGSPDNGNSWYITRTEIGFDENGEPYKIGYNLEGKK